MHVETVFILLFVVASTVAIASRKLRVPYTVALVATGLLLGALDVMEAPFLTKELLFAVFLPGLLFEAAYHLEFDEFKRHLVPIVSLAVPGVVVAIALVALLLTPFVGGLELEAGFTWEYGLVFGALIAATDPIAVVALFKSLGAPKRLGVLVEGESLLNDGTAVVLFGLALAFTTGEAMSGGDLLWEFVVSVGAGAAVGMVIGMAVAEVMKRVDDPMVEITLTTVAAYGSFVAAEHFHFSGVIATVAAGMLCGNYAATRGMTPSTRIAVEAFWEYLAFALNSIVFLLIGLQVELVGTPGGSPGLLRAWLPILGAYVAVTLARTFVVGGVYAGLAAARRPIPASWAVVLGWGGLRGGISMVLALSLAPTFPHRNFIITMTFGVVILVLLIHGMTMAPLLNRLGLAARHEARESFEQARGRLQVARRALAELQSMRETRFTDPDVLDALEAEYEERLEAARGQIRNLHLEHRELRLEEDIRARRRLLFAEKDELLEAYRRGLVSQDVEEHLLADIDARMTRLEEGLEGAEGSEGDPD
ncbi:MAG TPA: Na+/H+ antiporter [Longimicrobiales bacterium]|jgi:CPA1 family monovalent cation:H+ antiporter